MMLRTAFGLHATPIAALTAEAVCFGCTHYAGDVSARSIREAWGHLGMNPARIDAYETTGGDTHVDIWYATPPVGYRPQ